MENYLQGNYKHPYHVSVGAVVLNDKNEVLCHYFGDDITHGYFKEHNLSDFYVLMRETMNPEESLEETLHRGLAEEFGVKADIITYAGSIVGHHVNKGVEIEKTTLYFLTRLIDIDESKRTDESIEGLSKLEWRPVEFLIPKMREQTKRFKRTDLDESKVLEEAGRWINSNSNK